MQICGSLDHKILTPTLKVENKIENKRFVILTVRRQLIHHVQCDQMLKQKVAQKLLKK